MRHKSTVDCDFRPRPKSFSETTWIFPKQGRDVYVSTLERNQLVDTTWYTSKVSITGTSNTQQEVNGHATDADYSSTDEELFEETTPQNGTKYYSSSSDEEKIDYITNNNTKKLRAGSLDDSESSGDEM